MIAQIRPPRRARHPHSGAPARDRRRPGSAPADTLPRVHPTADERDAIPVHAHARHALWRPLRPL